MNIKYDYVGNSSTLPTYRYPYQYRIETGAWQLHEEEQVIDWIDATGIECVVAGTGIYIKDQRSLILFILKWQS